MYMEKNVKVARTTHIPTGSSNKGETTSLKIFHFSMLSLGKIPVL